MQLQIPTRALGFKSHARCGAGKRGRHLIRRRGLPPILHAAAAAAVMHACMHKQVYGSHTRGGSHQGGDHTREGVTPGGGHTREGVTPGGHTRRSHQGGGGYVCVCVCARACVLAYVRGPCVCGGKANKMQTMK